MNKINFTLILILLFIQAQTTWAQPSWEDNVQLKKDSREPQVVEPVVVEPKESLPDKIEEPEVDEPKEILPGGSDEDLPDMENEDD